MKTVSTTLTCHCWSLLSFANTESVVTTQTLFYSLPRLTRGVAPDLSELLSRTFCTPLKTVTVNRSFVSLCQKNPPIGPFVPKTDNNLGPDILFPNVFRVLPSVSVGPSLVDPSTLLSARVAARALSLATTTGRVRPLHISSCSEGLQPQTCAACACSLSPHITPV